MATRRNPQNPEPTETQPGPAPATVTSQTMQPPATIRTQQYDAGEGWDIGQRAPSDAYRALSDQGTGAPTGPVVHSHPGGYARQIVAKGQIVTEGVRRELDAAEAEAADDESRED